MPNLAARHGNALESTRTVIFGGTSGLGAAVSSGVLASSGKVCISSSNEANIAAAVKHLQSAYPGTTVSGAVADLSNKDTVRANITSILEQAVKEFGGPLDHIVYTAGDQHKPSMWKSLDTADAAFSGWTVRYQGPLIIGELLATQPGRYLKVAPTSSVSFTGGILGQRPHGGLVAGWTGALEVLNRSLAIEIAPVRVNTIAFGVIATEIWEKFGQDIFDMLTVKTLTKTAGTPQDAAEAYLFLMRCAFMTGQVITVDGGTTFL